MMDELHSWSYYKVSFFLIELNLHYDGDNGFHGRDNSMASECCEVIFGYLRC